MLVEAEDRRVVSRAREGCRREGEMETGWPRSSRAQVDGKNDF